MSGIRTGGQSAVLPGYLAVFVDATAGDSPVDVHTASGSIPFGATGNTAVAVPYTSNSAKVGLSITLAGLTGGTSPTVNATVFTSVDGVNWVTTGVTLSAALSANGNGVLAPASLGAGKFVGPYVQLQWATTGAPTAATLTDARIIVQNS